MLINNISEVKDLDIDTVNNYIYWVNTENISRSDINGDNIVTIITSPALQLALDVTEQKIYYTNVTGFGGVLKVYDIVDQSNKILTNVFRDYDNPKGLDFNPGDGIYHVGNAVIMKYDVDSDTNTVAVPNFQADHIAVDFEDRLVFWTDRTTKAIYKADTDFSVIEVIIQDTEQVFSTQGLAIDAENKLLFYSYDDIVYKNTYDGENPDTLYTAPIRNSSLTADHINQKLYFFDVSNVPSSIMSVNYDGSEQTVLINKQVGDPRGLVLDMDNDSLYFSRFVFGRGIIERVKTDGSERTIIFDSNNDDPIAGLLTLALDANNGRLYFESGNKMYKTAIDSSGFSEVYSESPTTVYGISVNIPLETDTSIEETSVPKVTTLLQNYPNPFNPSTVISFYLTEISKARLEVFDILGRKVATLINDVYKSEGTHSIIFDATDLSSGIYFYRLQVGGVQKTRSMLLMK